MAAPAIDTTSSSPAPAAAIPVPSAAAVPEINVSSLAPATSLPPPKKGSARDSMNQRLAKRFGGDEPAPSSQSQPDPKAPAKAAEPKAANQEPPAPTGEAPPPSTEPAADPKKGKANPWKLLDEERKARTAAEQARVEIEKRAIPEAEWKAKQEVLSKLEARNKELEDEIRYVNYQKSDEFKTKHQQPYEAAWKRAMDDLNEIPVQDPQTGQVRALKATDILDLVNMTLPDARASAVAKFGDFADDVMQHRKEIRRLYDEQAAAIEEVRKNGGEREKKQQEEQQAKYGVVSNEIKETWKLANETATKHEKYGKYFTPVEGDQDGNQRLAKGFELADRAFTENPLAPGLTAEQRREIVERHAVVRNRCAAFGRLANQVETARSRIAELEKELAGYKGTEPGTAGGNGRPAGAPAVSAREGMIERLRKRAVPV